MMVRFEVMNSKNAFILTINPAVVIMKIKHTRKHIKLRFLGYLWPIDELYGWKEWNYMLLFDLQPVNVTAGY